MGPWARVVRYIFALQLHAAREGRMHNAWTKEAPEHLYACVVLFHGYKIRHSLALFQYCIVH